MALMFSPSLLADRLRRASGMNYRYDRADSKNFFSSWPPRAAVNYLITPRQGLREYSQAIRSPDMFETNVNWSYRVSNFRRIAKRIGLGKTHVEWAGILQKCLDNQPTTFVDNSYDKRRGLYFSAELMF